MHNIYYLTRKMAVLALILIISLPIDIYSAEVRTRPIENPYLGRNNNEIQRLAVQPRSARITGFGNPLVDAADRGQRDEIINLLRSGHNVNSKGYYDTTALMRASARGYTDIAAILIDAGADVDAADVNNVTALKMSADGGHYNIADILLKNGANPNVLSEEQYVYLKEATRFRQQIRTQQPIIGQAGALSPDATTRYEQAKKEVFWSEAKEWAVFGGVAAGAGTAVYFLTREEKEKPPSEFDANYGLSRMNAADAYARGATGNGSTVAVIDGGVDIDHPDLAANIVSGFDFIDNDSNPSPEGQGFYRSHGTHVAGIIAATQNGSGMQGVAYEAKIMPLRAGTSDGSLTRSATSSAINYAADNNIRVMNNSWGSSTDIGESGWSRSLIQSAIPETISAFTNSTSKNTVVVFAAGNDGFTSPSVEAGLPVYFPEFKELWLAVVATDENNAIAEFSDRCGVAKEWCIAAPGVHIYSTYDQDDELDTNNDNYESISGTSMAAPHVAGAVAILMAQFPGLTSQQVIDLLLSTATDLGTPGVDDIYGNGLVNLAAATQPQGSMIVPTGSTVIGGGSDLNLSSLKLGSAFGDSLKNSNLNVAVLDSYKRAYLVKLSDLAETKPSVQDAYETLSEFGDNEFQYNVKIADNARTQFSYNTVRSEESSKYNGEPEYELEKASFSSDYKNSIVTANYNVPMQEAFAYQAISRDTKNNIGKNGLSNPYLGFSGKNRSAVINHNSDTGITYRSAGFYGSEEIDETVKTTGVVSEVSRKINDKISASVQFGTIIEEDTFLGSETSGAFDTNGGVPTYFAGMAGEYKIYPRIKLHGTINGGISYLETADDSLIKNFSPIVSNSVSTGITVSKVASENDSVGFIITQPLRVAYGSANMLLPQQRDAEGNIFYQEYKTGLVPDGREIDLELNYLLTLAEKTSLKTGAFYRIEPDNIKEADPEGLLLLKINHSF